MNLLGLLLSTLSSKNSVSSLSTLTGLAAAPLKTLVQKAVPVLLRYLTKNAASQDGAQSLLGALTQHTSNRAMADQIGEADTEDGRKIIGHIFGSDADKVVEDLSKETGIAGEDVTKALGGLAPALMSGLSIAAGSAKDNKAEGGFDFSSLVQQFGGKDDDEEEEKKEEKPAGLLGSIGSILGDAKESAGGLLGSLLGKDKKEEKEEEKDESGFDGSALLSSLMSFMK